MIRILAVAIAVELCLIFAAAILLILRRRRNIARGRRLGEARERVAQWLGDVLSGGTAPQPSLAGLSLEDARLVLVQVGEQVDLEGRRILKSVYAASSLAASSSRDLAGPPLARLVLTREARALDDPASLLGKLLRDPEAEVRLTALEALSEIGRAAECISAIETLSGVGPRTRARMIDALAASRTHPTLELAALLDAASPETVQVALAVLGFAQDLTTVPKIETCLTSADVEVRLQALRALRSIGDPASFDAVRPLLSDPRWEVRVEAIRASAALGRDRAWASLAPLLTDEADWVRHHAALALAAAGESGVALLRSAAEGGVASAKSAMALYQLGLEVAE